MEELELEFEVNQLGIMVEPQRRMLEYTKPLLIGIESNIVRPSIIANNFEIKLNII